MDPTHLLLVSFAVLALVFLLTLVAIVREKRALGRLVESAVDFDAVQEAITQLPAPHQEIAAQMVEAINLRSTLDEALTKAVVRATNESFEPPLARRLITNAALAFVFFAPISLALVQVADRVVSTYHEAQSLPSAQVYLMGLQRLRDPFSVLHSVMFVAAWLVAGLALWWAMSWWLLRPEVREARFVRALLECASRLRPGVGAPVSARLCELVAPDRGIARPAVATVLWFLAVTAGWGILYATGSVRTANASDTVFDVWPKTTQIGTTEALPTHFGGRPLPTTPQPSLFFDGVALRLGATPISELLEDGTLPDNWRSTAPDLTATVKNYSPLEPLVMATPNTRVGTLLDALEVLGGRYRIARYHLVAQRAFGATSAKRNKAPQATIPIHVGAPEVSPGLVVQVSETGVHVNEENANILFTDAAWRIHLRDAVRFRPDLYGVESRAPMQVDVDRDLDYDTLVDVLGAADTSCMGTIDCGLPGLGVEFVLRGM